MGQVSTEQAVKIIDSVGEAINNAQPNVQPESPANYWWLLIIAIIPVLLGYWLNKRRKK